MVITWMCFLRQIMYMEIIIMPWMYQQNDNKRKLESFILHILFFPAPYSLSFFSANLCIQFRVLIWHLDLRFCRRCMMDWPSSLMRIFLYLSVQKFSPSRAYQAEPCSPLTSPLTIGESRISTPTRVISRDIICRLGVKQLSVVDENRDNFCSWNSSWNCNGSSKIYW